METTKYTYEEIKKMDKEELNQKVKEHLIPGTFGVTYPVSLLSAMENTYSVIVREAIIYSDFEFFYYTGESLIFAKGDYQFPHKYWDVIAKYLPSLSTDILTGRIIFCMFENCKSFNQARAALVDFYRYSFNKPYNKDVGYPLYYCSELVPLPYTKEEISKQFMEGKNFIYIE